MFMLWITSKKVLTGMSQLDTQAESAAQAVFGTDVITHFYKLWNL
jgi:hypothetical protein